MLAVFGDFALTSARVLRATSDAQDLAITLKSTLRGADLRRVEALTEDKLRGALVVAMGEWPAAFLMPAVPLQCLLPCVDGGTSHRFSLMVALGKCRFFKQAVQESK
eukprot:1156011-Pelagomonas_calceolata.AAC.4